MYRHSLVPSKESVLDYYASWIPEFSSLDLVDRILQADLLAGLPDCLLVKMDIASMSYGLETRSPLLDHSLIEYVGTLPHSMRVSLTRTKPLLRDIAAELLPREIVRAPKRGFEIPVKKWLRNELLDDCSIPPRFRWHYRSSLSALRLNLCCSVS